MSAEPVSIWICSCGERRETPFKFVGPGAPGCPKCGLPMTRLGEAAPAVHTPAPARVYEPADTMAKEKPKLLLLLERLEADPNPQRQQHVLVSEYTWSVAAAALECIQVLQAMYPERKT